MQFVNRLVAREERFIILRLAQRHNAHDRNQLAKDKKKRSRMRFKRQSSFSQAPGQAPPDPGPAIKQGLHEKETLGLRQDG